MYSQKIIDTFLVSKGDAFPIDKLQYIRERLANLPDNKFNMIYSLEFKKPATSLILSLFFGCYGIDRFYIGNVGLGVGKLLTCGGCGIWAIVDWFLIRKATKKVNFEKFMQMISLYGG
jgi:TM2 domain-containing membrane protein YozV